MAEGVLVISQRDERTLGHLLAHVDPAFEPDEAAIDHHESPWYREYFAG